MYFKDTHYNYIRYNVGGTSVRAQQAIHHFPTKSMELFYYRDYNYLSNLRVILYLIVQTIVFIRNGNYVWIII